MKNVLFPEIESMENGESIQSPIFYPGSKRKIAKSVYLLLPEKTKVIASPFLGGGSIELMCASKGIQVYASDIFEPLINFWKQAKLCAHDMADEAEKYYPLKKERFYSLKKNFSEIKDNFERAVVFFVLNLCSFRGTSISGGMQPEHPCFNEKTIDRLRIFKANNLHVELLHYKDALRKHKHKITYLDPPYDTDSHVYGFDGVRNDEFDHDELYLKLKDRKRWILSYNDSDEVCYLYDSFKIHYLSQHHGMSNNKFRDILIINL